MMILPCFSFRNLHPRVAQFSPENRSADEAESEPLTPRAIFQKELSALLQKSEFVFFLEERNSPDMRGFDLPGVNWGHHDKPWLDLLEVYLFEEKNVKSVKEIVSLLKSILEEKLKSALEKKEGAKDRVAQKKVEFFSRLISRLQNFIGLEKTPDEEKANAALDGEQSILDSMNLPPRLKKIMKVKHAEIMGVFRHGFVDQFKMYILNDKAATKRVLAWRRSWAQAHRERVEAMFKSKEHASSDDAAAEAGWQAAGGAPGKKPKIYAINRPKKPQPPPEASIKPSKPDIAPSALEQVSLSPSAIANDVSLKSSDLDATVSTTSIPFSAPVAANDSVTASTVTAPPATGSIPAPVIANGTGSPSASEAPPVSLDTGNSVTQKTVAVNPSPATGSEVISASPISLSSTSSSPVGSAAPTNPLSLPKAA